MRKHVIVTLYYIACLVVQLTQRDNLRLGDFNEL
jgi:hypothetical protein